MALSETAQLTFDYLCHRRADELDLPIGKPAMPFGEFHDAANKGFHELLTGENIRSELVAFMEGNAFNTRVLWNWRLIVNIDPPVPGSTKPDHRPTLTLLPKPESKPKPPQPPLFRVQSAKGALALLRGGADPNERDYRGDTPLHVTPFASVARVLLMCGADPHLRNNNGWTAWHVTQSMEVTEVIRCWFEMSDNKRA